MSNLKGVYICIFIYIRKKDIPKETKNLRKGDYLISIYIVEDSIEME